MIHIRTFVVAVAVLFARVTDAQTGQWWVRGTLGIGPGGGNKYRTVSPTVVREVGIAHRIGPRRALELSYLSLVKLNDNDVCLTSTSYFCPIPFSADGARVTITQLTHVPRGAISTAISIGAGALHLAKGIDPDAGMQVSASVQPEFHVGWSLVGPALHPESLAFGVGLIVMPFAKGGALVMVPLELSVRIW